MKNKKFKVTFVENIDKLADFNENIFGKVYVAPSVGSS